MYRNVLWCFSIGIGVNKCFDVCMYLLEIILKDCYKINSNMVVRYFIFYMSKLLSWLLVWFIRVGVIVVYWWCFVSVDDVLLLFFLYRCICNYY